MAVNFFFPMDKGFIDRIHKIIITNIANENFGVGDLASLIGLSTSQTLRKVKAITGKSVNQYINEVRLTEAAKLIEETDLTAAEIAYKVGFGSPSYFNKTFHKHYGLTPGDYKTKNESLQKLALKNAQKGTSHIISNRNILYLITIAMLFMVGYLIISNAASSKNKHEKTSIAVMPFKTLGKKSDSLSVADALTELVLDNLSKVNALIVKSKNASEQFKDSIMSSSTIGKKLKADYLVNGSVQYYGDSIRVIARLDNTETDEQIWSQTYLIKRKDIFSIESEISKQIVSQLNITISPQEIKMFETPMTNNIQAYEYYIKGKALADERSYSGLTNSIVLFKRAITLDSEFGHAYAEIANSYSQLNIHAISNDSIKKVNLINIENYLNLAEKINPNIARIYTVRGNLFLQEMQYNKAEEYLIKALKINPNDEIVQLHTGVFYLLRHIPEVDKYLYHVNKALEIDPVSTHLKRSKIWALIENNMVDEAEKALEEYKSDFSKGNIYHHNAQIIAYKNKDWNVAYKYLKEALVESPKDLSLLWNIIPLSNTLNKNEEYLNYLKLMNTLVKNNAFIIYSCANSLIKNKKFEELEDFLNTEDVKKVLEENSVFKDFIYFDYYFYQGNYEKALELVNNGKFVRNKSNSLFNPLYKSLIFAKQGKHDEIYKIMKTHPYSSLEKARIFAVMQKRDSMYHYLNGKANLREVTLFNGYIDFDPYREEPRFKAFSKKYYFIN